MKPELRVLPEAPKAPERVSPAPAAPGPWALWRQLILAAALAGLAWWAWTEEDRLRAVLGLAPAEAPSGGGRAPGAMPVIAARVGQAADTLTFELVGTGRAARSVMLRAEDSGVVTATPLAAGIRYDAGDVLLTLDDHEQRTALALAEARLAEAERILDRQEKLIASGVSTTARVDEARTAAEIAALEVEAARRELADRTVRAPFDGVAGLPQVDVGDRVESDAPIASFDDNSVLLVEFELPEALLSRIAPGMAVSAATPAWPERRFEGEVSAIDTRVDPASRTARVRVSLPNDEGLLRPGASFTVRLELPGETYPTVPELALQFSRGGLHVWRLTGDEVERVALRMVRRRADEVLVDGPLAPGERVIVEGTQRLSPGRPVRVVGGDGA